LVLTKLLNGITIIWVYYLSYNWALMKPTHLSPVQ
jgi:hypothetical protein